MAEDFASVVTTVLPPAESEVQVRDLWMAIDPATRDPAFASGELVSSRLVCRIAKLRGTPVVPRNLTMMIKSIRMEGFIVLDHLDIEQHFLADMRAWHQAGLLKPAETVHEGIDSALTAFAGLFSGDNLGRTLVRLA